MEPSDFVTFAGRIAALGPAGARSAVSRAYYGVFHLAISLLEELECAPPRNANAHRLVYEFLDCATQSDAQDAAAMLRDLHRERLNADYRLGVDRFEAFEFARSAVETAHEARSHLDAFRAACVDEAMLEEFREKVAASKARRQL